MSLINLRDFIYLHGIFFLGGVFFFLAKEAEEEKTLYMDNKLLSA